MTYEELASLVEDPLDLDAMVEDLFDDIQLTRHLDVLGEEDVWGWQ